MTAHHATAVPMETGTYIIAFVPYRRIREWDLATFLWIDLEPPCLVADDVIAMLREAVGDVFVVRDLPRGWIARVPAQGFTPDHGA